MNNTENSTVETASRSANFVEKCLSESKRMQNELKKEKLKQEKIHNSIGPGSKEKISEWANEQLNEYGGSNRTVTNMNVEEKKNA
eukprot:g2440.t1